MKKSIKFLFAAIAILTVASCAKEELLAPSGDAELRTVTVSLSDTKTSLDASNHVVWTAGDSIWISNGNEVSSWIVPEEAEGQKSFSFTTILSGDLYVVYPAAAAKGVNAGKLSIVVPGAQDGSFSTANICVGKADANLAVNLHNATAIAKIAVDDEAASVKTLSISSTAPLAGDCEVTFTGTDIAVAAGESTFGGISVQDASGELYVAVIPGTYPAGFQFSAISTELQTETKTTTVANTIEVNDFVDLGTIGTNMTDLTGEGTEGSPYLIKNLAEWLALAYYVNDDPENTMENKFIKVENDIDGISACVGGIVNDGENDIDYYFKGNFDGNNKTLKVNLTGDNAVALFGDVTAPATFKNVKVEGVATGTDYVAGIAGMVNGGAGVSFTNCQSAVAVNGAKYVGGIAGYTDGIVSFSSCVNNGALTATSHFTAGIAATATNGTFSACSNNGVITNGKGQCVGGICGRAYNKSQFDNCTNTASVTTDERYVGGILGYFNNNADTLAFNACSNSGELIAGSGRTTITSGGKAVNYTIDSYCGGIIGYMIGKKTTVSGCTNSGTIDVSEAGGNACGIIGFSNGSNGIIENCTNEGDIIGVAESYPNYEELPVYVQYIAGITGYTALTSIKNCENRGTVSAAGANYVSGIEGSNRNSSVNDSANYGNITGKNNTAGITGYQNWSNCQRCTNKGNVTGETIVGGVVAYNHKAGGIYSCCNEGNITGGQQIGGVVGLMTTQANQNMQNCYNTGAIKYKSAEATNPFIGGIVGRHQYGQIQNVYSSGSIGCAGGEISAAALVSVGGVAGVLGAGQTVNYCYYLESGCSQLCGGTNPYEGKFYAVETSGNFKDGVTVLFAGTKLGDLESAKISETMQNWVINTNNTWLTWVFKDNTTPAFGPIYVKL